MNNMDNIWIILVNNYTFGRVNNELIPDITIIYLAVLWHVVGVIYTINAADQRLDLFQINLCGVTLAMAATAPPW